MADRAWQGRGPGVEPPKERRGVAARPLVRVLVAEDDPDILAVVALALGRVGGMQVTCCADGLAALAQVPAVDPELILLDVMMPELDGLETLARLRADPRTAAIPVVFMTARVQPRDLAAYHARGALAVIAKPFDPMTLAQQLRKLHADTLRPA
jgi:two-component system OmpR family response regulator